LHDTQSPRESDEPKGFHFRVCYTRRGVVIKNLFVAGKCIDFCPDLPFPSSIEFSADALGSSSLCPQDVVGQEINSWNVFFDKSAILLLRVFVKGQTLHLGRY
jgi:hypothetical protein